MSAGGTTGPPIMAINGDDPATSSPAAANDNGAVEFSDEDVEAQAKNKDPHSEQEEPAISSDQPPAPSPEPANDNSPVEELPATGTD